MIGLQYKRTEKADSDSRIRVLICAPSLAIYGGQALLAARTIRPTGPIR